MRPTLQSWSAYARHVATEGLPLPEAREPAEVRADLVANIAHQKFMAKCSAPTNEDLDDGLCNTPTSDEYELIRTAFVASNDEMLGAAIRGLILRSLEERAEVEAEKVVQRVEEMP